MKVKLFLFTAVIVIALVNNGSFDDFFGSTSGQQHATSGNPSAPHPVTPDPKGVWPYLDEQSKQASLSDDLLRSNYYVVFDGSGSMSQKGCSGDTSKEIAAKNALVEFSRIVPANANLGMLVFDDHGISERTPLGINNREQFRLQVRQTYANRGTPLYSSIKMAYNKITQQAKKQLGYGEYHIIIVTDGEADDNENPRKLVDKIISSTPIVIQTIGFCINTRHSLNQPGKTIYKAATDIQSLKQGLKDVLAESPSFSAQQF